MGCPSLQAFFIKFCILLHPFGSDADPVISRSFMSAAYNWRGKVLEKTPGRNSIGSSGEIGTEDEVSQGLL